MHYHRSEFFRQFKERVATPSKWILFCLASTSLMSKPLQEECTPGPEYMRVGWRHIEGNGVGYNTGYTTAEMFLAAPPERFHTTPFIDLRGHIFDNGRWAANGGLGIRGILKDRVYGLNLYYDYRNSKRKNYNQISCGIETLGNRWDFRWNGYFPIGNTKSKGYHSQFDHFSGNSMYITRKFEYALLGTNAEAGFHFAQVKDVSFYGALGPYYFKGPLGPNLWGGEARLNGKYKEYVKLEVSYSYDNVFRNIVQGQFFLMIPLSPKSSIKKKKKASSSCENTKILYERMVQPVERDEIIVLGHRRKQSLAINPATNRPYTFWFVDNTSHSAGTFESPFSTLADAQNSSQPSDVIYVFPGDGTTTGLDAGITLQDNQRLWGSSIPHSLPTTHGTVTIPATSSGSYNDIIPPIILGAAPQLTNTGGSGDVVTVANNNEIAGFYIQPLTGNGIIANSSITNLTIKNNVLQGPANLATTNKALINVADVQGTLLITENLIYPGGSDNNQTNVGILINAINIQNANYIISNNDAPANADFLIATYTDCANISTTISQNDFNVFRAVATMTFYNATAQAAHSVNIEGNTIYADAGDSSSVTCIFLALQNNANVTAQLVNNILFTPDASGFAALLTENSQMNLTVANNEIACWVTPIAITLGDPSNLQGFQPTITASISDNTLVFDEGAGINIFTYDNAAANLSILSNAMSGVSQNYGGTTQNVYVETNQNATALTTLSDNLMQSGTTAISFATYDNSEQIATITNNNVTHVEFYGLTFETDATSQGIWKVDGNFFVATPSGAILATSNGTSTTCLSVTNNFAAPVQLPGGPGTYQFTNSGGTFQLEPLSGNIGIVTETGVITPVPGGTCQ